MTESPSPQTQVKRGPELAVYDRETIVSILEQGLIAHVGIVTEDGVPVVVPMLYAVDGDHLLVHGSAASRLMRSSTSVCVTVTIVDGFVVARSLFESSMNYRSVVVFGVPEVLSGTEKHDALVRLSDLALPGRVAARRGPSDKEVRATIIWRLALDEASAKVRSGPPVDDPDDVDLPHWGGVVPLRVVAGPPEADDVGRPMETPDHIARLADRFQ